MSNPTLLVESFNGSLGVFTGIDPIRFDEGLWLEEGTTNLVPNPVALTDTTGWTTLANRTLERVTSLPAPLPDWLDGLVTTCFRVTAAITNPGSNIASFNITLTAAAHVHSWYVYVPTNVTSAGVILTVAGFTSMTGTGTATVNLGLRDQWQRVESATFTPDAGDLSGTMILTGAGTMQAGQEIYFAAVQVEQRPRASSFALNSFGDGYSGTTTHIRAASSAALDPTVIIDPTSGAIAFRVTPTIETGLEEIWGECGVKGSSTDHVQWGRDASTHPFVEWSANNAAYQRLTGTETLAAGTECLFYTDWDGTAIRLSIDNGTIQTDTRDAVSDSWGAGDLVLKAE